MNGAPKSILFVLNDGRKAGATIYAQKIINFLKINRKDLLVDVVIAHNSKSNISLERSGIRVVDIGDKLAPNSTVILKFIKRFRYYLRFAYLDFVNNPKLIYSNTITNNAEVVIAKILGVKTLVHSHEGLLMARRMRLRLKISCFFTNKYIGVSKYSADVIFGILKRQCLVIENGIEFDSINLFLKKISDIRIIGIVGTVDHNKGQLLLVKALKILINDLNADIYLRIIGSINDQNYADEIMKYCVEHRLTDRVIFTGAIEGISKVYSQIDCLVSASYDEAMPLVLLEAMALGIPLVASTAGGNKEIIDDGETGQLFPVGDFEELSRRLYAMYINPKKSLEMAEVGRKRVRETHNLNNKLTLISEEIYKSITQEGCS